MPKCLFEVLGLGWLFLSYVISMVLFYGDSLNRWTDLVIFLIITFCWLAFCNFYDPKRARKSFGVLSFILSVLVLFVIALIRGEIGLLSPIFFWILSFVGLLTVNKYTSYPRDSGNFCVDKRVLVVGSGQSGLAFVEQVKEARLCSIVGIADNEIKDERFKAYEFPVFTIEEIPNVLARERVDEVWVFLPVRSHYDDILRVIEACTLQGIPVILRASWDVDKLFTAKDGYKVWLDQLGSFSVVETGSPLLKDPLSIVLKRVIDIFVSLIALVLTSPIMLLSIVAIKLTSRGPAFFKQKRVGLGKRLFTIYKLRTMYEDAEERIKELEKENITKGAAFKMINDPRITPVGRILRKLSIDELPQLFNVLKGDMSLVGPRPLPLRDYERFYNDSHRRRFMVKPGITGLWQISGRSRISFDEWMKLDLYYIDNWSLKMDFVILFKTVGVVLKGVGAV